MADRVKLIIQKRTSLKSQITILANLFDNGDTDDSVLRLRINRLTNLYHAFEDFNDELAVLDSNDMHQTEFSNIQERFYTLAGSIENKLNAANASSKDSSTANDESSIENASTVTPAKRRIKLPEAPLPTFDGKFKNWLTFKNAFSSMIGSQTDLTDIDKLHYLKSALTGEASNKIKIFATDGVNYAKAWELLERSYEVKRILVTRHISGIVNLPVLDKERTDGLTKLADDVQQHIASLSTLGITIGPEMIIYLIEGKLPKSTLDKWESTLDRDTLPKLEDMYEFLYKTAVCASRRERAKPVESNKCKGEPPFKKKKIDSLNRTFVVKTSRNCVVCKGKQHPLYMCNGFKQLAVAERIETVRKAKLCYNCLRSHLGTPCKFSCYTICQKRHNTLLHNDNHTNNSNPPNSMAIQSK